MRRYGTIVAWARADRRDAPAPAADVATIAPGTLVLAALEHPHKPNQFHHFGLFLMGTEGELHSDDYRVEPGAFLVLGAESQDEHQAEATPSGSDRYADCFDDHMRMYSDWHDLDTSQKCLGRPYNDHVRTCSDPSMDSYQWHLMQGRRKM